MQTSFQVVRFDDNYRAEYDSFVGGHSESLLYHSSRYCGFIEELLGAQVETLLALDDHARIKAVLPLLSMDGPLGRVYNSLPYYGSNGSALYHDVSAANDIYALYNELACAAGTAASTVITNPRSKNHPTQEIAHNLTSVRIGQLTNIQYSSDQEAQLMLSFHSKTRNMIRKAQKNGVITSIENEMIPFLEDVHNENMAAIGGTPKSSDFFKLFPKYFKPASDYNLYVARINELPVAALLLFNFNDTVEYYTPVVREEFREKQPLSQLIYSAMIDASSAGYKLWNWGGTWLQQDGVHRFKKRWGTTDSNYMYYTQINNDKVFCASQETLLAEYPNFFVIPFEKLKGRQNSA